MSVFLLEILNQLGQWLRPFQYQSALAIVATLLVIFGNDINGAIKALIAKQHFFIRTLIFVLICAFGYGLLAVWLTSLLAQYLANIPTVYLAPVLLCIFVVLGIYMQKKRYI